MGRRRRPRGRKINGILLLDKPVGQTSNAVLQTVKRLFKAEKAGHTGSLDPLADGLLPVCLGTATKVSAFLLDADKHYQVTVKLGETTATADAEGEVLEQKPVDGITEAQVQTVLGAFIGPQKQLPPMYSALKHNGERLYKLAREGKVVEREPRDIHLYNLKMESFSLPYFTMQVDCSKGTYVRTLAEDIGAKLGCGAHVATLRRNGVGPYGEDGMVTLERLQEMAEEGLFATMDKLLLPLDSALDNWPRVDLNRDSEFYLKQGQAVLVPRAPSDGWVRIYGETDGFIGVGEIDDDGRIAPKRLMISDKGR